MMVPLYLVTGFLGSGKTTFMKNFLPLFQGGKTAVIVNDFGRENVDEALLQKAGAYLSGISGGSIFCACRLDQFEKALADALQTAPDAIVVETSGLSDPSGLSAALTLRPEFSVLDPRGCLCVLDSKRLPALYQTARVLEKQIRAADLLILNKCDIAPPEPAEAILHELCPNTPVLRTSYGQIPPQWTTKLLALRGEKRPAGMLTADIGLHRLTLLPPEDLTQAELREGLTKAAAQTDRIKGFARVREGLVYVDGVGEEIEIRPVEASEAGAVPVGRLSVLFTYGQKPKPLLPWPWE